MIAKIKARKAPKRLYKTKVCAMIQPETNPIDRLEEFISQEDMSKIADELVTCPEINTSMAGTICELSKNHARSVFIPTADMVIDEHGLVYDAFIFGAANYVAQAAINKEYSILISSKASFYAPLKFGDVLQFEAQALFDESARKREVRVIGQVNDIKVFESSMSLVVTEEHVFHLKRPDAKESVSAKKNESKIPTDDEKALSQLNAL